MKILLIVLLSLMTFGSNAQTASEKSLIQQSVINFFEGISSLDYEAMRAEVTGDFTLIEHGLVWNADSLINHLKPMEGQKITRINKLDFSKSEQQGDVAWVYYFNTAELSKAGKTKTIRWLESAVLVKQSGKWKIKMMHSTDLK